MATPESRPLGFGDLDRNKHNQHPDVDILQSVNGYPDGSVPSAKQWNTLGNQWSSWHRHLDSRALRIERLSVGLNYRLSSDVFEYHPGPGLADKDVVTDTCYVIGGYVVDLPKTRLAQQLLDPYTFTASKWHHFYVDTAGNVSVDIVNIGVAASPPAGSVHLGTGKTNATDLTAFEDAPSEFATAHLKLTLPLEVDSLSIVGQPGETPLSVTGVSATLPAILATNTAGGGAYLAAIGTSTGFGFKIPLGNSAATGFLGSLTSSPSGARGLKITADAASAGHAAELTHAGSGSALRVVSTGTVEALLSVGSASASYGATLSGACIVAPLRVDGTGAAAAAYMVSDGSATLLATSTNTSGKTLDLGTSGSATSSARALRAMASGSAIAGEFIAVANYALKVQGDTTSPIFAEILFAGQNARPSSTFDGGLQWNTTERQLTITDATDGGSRGLWATPGGKATGHTANNATTTNGGAVWVTCATCSSLDSNAPKVAGRQATLRFRCEARMTVATPGVLNVRLRDTISGTTLTRSGAGSLDSAGYVLSEASTSWQRAICLDWTVTIPATGDRTWVAEIQTGTADNVRVRDAALWLEGLY